MSCFRSEFTVFVGFSRPVLWETVAYLRRAGGIRRCTPPLCRTIIYVLQFSPPEHRKFNARIHSHKCFSFWGLRSPDLVTGLCPLDPTGGTSYTPVPKAPDSMPPCVNPKYATGEKPQFVNNISCELRQITAQSVEVGGGAREKDKIKEGDGVYVPFGGNHLLFLMLVMVHLCTLCQLAVSRWTVLAVSRLSRSSNAVRRVIHFTRRLHLLV